MAEKIRYNLCFRPNKTTKISGQLSAIPRAVRCGFSCIAFSIHVARRLLRAINGAVIFHFIPIVSNDSFGAYVWAERASCAPNISMVSNSYIEIIASLINAYDID